MINQSENINGDSISFQSLKKGEIFIYEHQKYTKTSKTEARSLDGGGLLKFVNVDTIVNKCKNKRLEK